MNLPPSRRPLKSGEALGTPNDVAFQYRLSHTKIRELLKAGLLPSIKRGNRRYIHPDDAAALLLRDDI